MILFFLPRKIFFSILKSLVLLCNDHPSPFDKLINIEFPAFVFNNFGIWIYMKSYKIN